MINNIDIYPVKGAIRYIECILGEVLMFETRNLKLNILLHACQTLLMLPNLSFKVYAYM